MIQKTITKISIGVYLFIAPFLSVVNAEECGPGKGDCFGKVDSLFTRFGSFIDNILIPLVFTLALLIFVWGMFRFFVWGQANEEDRSKGRQMILWSVIGMMFMVSIWGIVNIFADGIFGNVSGGQGPALPSTPTL